MPRPQPRNRARYRKGKATRVFAEILEDGNLRSRHIPDNIRNSLEQFKAGGVDTT